MIRRILPLMIVIALLTAAFVPFGRINVSAESTVTVTAAEFGKENGQEVTSATVKGISFEFAQSTAGNPPKYYSNPSAVRTYKNNNVATEGNTLTISAESAITKIVFEFDTAKSGVPVPDTGEYDKDSKTWTGNSKAVVFTTTVDQVRYAAFTITVDGTLEGGTEPSPSEPVEEPTPVLDTPEKILTAAYALEAGKALDGTFTLTGVIKSVDTAYNSNHKNVTVTMVVGDLTDKPIQCFRLVNGNGVENGVETIGENDTITVTGKIKNFKGTVEFDANCTLDAFTKAEQPATEEPVEVLDTPEKILTAAYALETGKALDGEYTLTGVIKSVDTAYNSEYKNVTVTMVVGELTDKPIQCFRLVNGNGVENGVETIGENDTITVTGKIKNFKGTVEFDANCTLDAFTKAEQPATEEPAEVLDTPEKILTAAYALETGKALDGEYTLTGVVTKINTPYNSEYKNVTVTIEVAGLEDKPIQCYRLEGEGCDAIAKGDTITVKGKIKNYNGTVEFDAKCALLERVPGENQEEAPVLDTPEKILEALYALEDGDFLTGEYTLTGVIKSVDTAYNSDYKNVTVTIIVNGDSDRPVMCYRLAGDGADVIGEGDTVTVKGPMKNHGGTYEFAQGCVIVSYEKAEVTPPQTGDAEVIFSAVVIVLALSCGAVLLRRKKED